MMKMIDLYKNKTLNQLLMGHQSLLFQKITTHKITVTI